MSDELLPDAGGEGGVAPDPAREFAALMSSAASAAAPGPGDAPYGFTTDRATGEQRPKKAAGRPRKSPSLDELRDTAEADAAGSPAGAPGYGDRAPDESRRRRRGRARASSPGPAPAPAYSPGQICRGMNRLYRKAGKIVSVWDDKVGKAITAAAANTDEDGGDDSVGAAWEQLARANPRIRRFCLRLLTGGAVGQLLTAHLPILLAVLLHDSIRSHIPFARVIEAMAGDDDDQADGKDDGKAGGGLLAGLEPGDMRQMFTLLSQLGGDSQAPKAA